MRTLYRIAKVRNKSGLKGIAMVTVLIFVLLVTIISGAMLSLMTKQARLAEHQIRRIRAFYAAESAINKAYQSLRYVADTSGGASAPPSTQWTEEGTPGVWKWTWNAFEWDAGTIPIKQDHPVIVIFDTTTTELKATVGYGS